jgi:hypothetical protein
MEDKSTTHKQYRFTIVSSLRVRISFCCVFSVRGLNEQSSITAFELVKSKKRSCLMRVKIHISNFFKNYRFVKF